MSLFSRKNEGGLMDVIRCDEQSYLIWKWKPQGALANTTKKENSIRLGSSIRVKEGEVAVFVYKQKDGTLQDFLEGPYDGTIKSANFPILTSIIGLAFDGNSPFQAEIYFINLASVIQTKFAVPFFDVFDPRFSDFAVPVCVRGTLNFKISDYKEFIKLHRLINFELDDFEKQIRDSVCKYVKGVIANIPSDNGIPVMQIERKILQINEIVENYLKPRLESDFGVKLSAMDIGSIEVDKESDGYRSLKSVTQEQSAKLTQAQTDVNIKNIQEMQRLQALNLEETQRIQREEMQRSQKLQTESMNLAAHQINMQTNVGIESAKAFGQIGATGATGVNLGNGMGLNPAGMVAGMSIGNAIGANMVGLMSGTGQQLPPNIPVQSSIKYNVVENGQSTGPFDIQTLKVLYISGRITKETLVWTSGMSNWEKAGERSDLLEIFNSVPNVPPIPPIK